MSEKSSDKSTTNNDISTATFETFETAWCPGCGDHIILTCLKRALTELGKNPHDVLIVAGIGQAAKTPQYISANAFCGLHGRALPAAVAAKIANEDLTVVVNSGDGDSYGEGGNHFIHNIRRNVDIAHFVHDNQIYGLTKGQASPTSQTGHVTGVQVNGKVRGNVDLPRDCTRDEAVETAEKDEVISRFLEGKTIVKVIYVPGKILNFVVK